MQAEPSLFSFIVHAGAVVQIVILILAIASIASWTIIFERMRTIKQARLSAKQFETDFWAANDLANLFDQTKVEETGIATIFCAGFQEYTRLSLAPHIDKAAILEGCERAMRIAQAHEMSRLEKNLSFLATTGSTSPYVGLFGTVWGIMTSFRALGTVQQATLSAVAPGIAEALIATAIGLFAAIPAVVAYNHFNKNLESIHNQYETFIEEFANLIHRETHAPQDETLELSAQPAG